MDLHAAGPRQPPRPRLPRCHPDPELLGRRQERPRRPALAREGGRGVAGHGEDRRRPGVRPGGRAPGHGAGHRQGQVVGAQRGRSRQRGPRGAAGGLRRDGRPARARRHAVGQCRVRAQCRAVGRRGAPAGDEPALHRRARRRRAGHGARLRHERRRRGQAPGEAKPEAARAVRLVHRRRGTPGDRPRAVLRQPAGVAPRLGRAQGLRALAGRRDPGRHPLGQRPGRDPARVPSATARS